MRSTALRKQQTAATLRARSVTVRQILCREVYAAAESCSDLDEECRYRAEHGGMRHRQCFLHSSAEGNSAPAEPVARKSFRFIRFQQAVSGPKIRPVISGNHPLEQIVGDLLHALVSPLLSDTMP